MTGRTSCGQGHFYSRPDALVPGELHLWAARHDGRRGAPAAELLSPAELARAARLMRESDGDRFIHSHAFLRRVLAGYIGIAPSEIDFAIGKWGKPQISDHQRSQPIEFSLSHSVDVTLVGVASGFPVGVDVEAVRRVDDYEGLAERFFADTEYRALRSLPELDRLRGFFACWTVKEAVVKALGTGLSTPLKAFEVALGADPTVRGAELDEAGHPGEQWSVIRAEPFSGFMAAAAVPWPTAKVRWMSIASNRDATPPRA
jgi:4'-phosphopantetheinyl transferase